MGEYTPIRNLKPGQKDMTLMFIVLDIGRPNNTKEGHEVRTVKVADKTGSINLSLWDEPGKHLQSGDIIRMTKGYTNIWKNCLTLYVGKGGEFIKIGEFCLIFSEIPFLSDPNNPELTPVNSSPSGGGGAPAGPPGSTPQGGLPKQYGRNNGGGKNGHDATANGPRSMGNADPRARANGIGGGGGKWGQDRRNQSNKKENKER